MSAPTSRSRRYAAPLATLSIRLSNTYKVQTETQAARIAAEAAAIEAAENLAREAAAAKKADEKKAAAAKKEEKAAACKALAANPIFQANGVIVTLTAVFLGVGAYRKHQAGQFSCKVAGIWTVGVASFACADYFVSNWLWKRFPAKK